jgi:hypothetical protein
MAIIDADVIRLERTTVALVKADLKKGQLGFATDTNTMVRRNQDDSYTEWEAGAGDVNGPASSTDGHVVGFDGTSGKDIRDLGFALTHNADFDLAEYVAADGSKIKIGYDDVIPFKNDTGAQLAAGTYMHLVNVTIVGSEYLATFEKTNASKWEKIQGTIGATTTVVANGATGFIATKGQISGVDTSTFSAPAQMWLSATTDGAFTDVEPPFPAYSISVGGIINSAVSGNLLVNITGDYKETFHDGWDGSIRQSFDFRVSATGGVITGTLKNVDPTEDLTCLFSGGFFTLDTTTTDLNIVLTAGTDEAVTTNYVFVPKTTKVLTVNTTFKYCTYCRNR